MLFFGKWKRKYKELEQSFNELLESSKELIAKYEANVGNFEERLRNAAEINKKNVEVYNELKKEYNDLQKRYLELEDETCPKHMVIRYATERPVILNAAVHLDKELVDAYGSEYKEQAIRTLCEQLVNEIYEKKLYRLNEEYDRKFFGTNLAVSLVVSDPNSQFIK